MLLRRRGSAEPECYSLTGATGWQTVWLPAAAELGLELVPLLGNGAFTHVPPEELPEIMAQLAKLREWMTVHGHSLYVEHLDHALSALSAVQPGDDVVSFG